MKVEYINHYGDDDMVVNAARVSFAKESNNYTDERNNKLIKYLADHNHIAPFFHPQITLREKVPIFVARQRFKHVVGFNYSEVSRRYVDDTPEFFIPDVWRKRAENVKQGSSETSTVETMRNYMCLDVLDRTDLGDTDTVQSQYKHFIEVADGLYREMLKAGIAPEQVRMVLPQSMYTEYYCTGSLAAWARAYKLRIDSHAQKEIRELAVKWDEIIRPLFPTSWETLVG